MKKSIIAVIVLVVCVVVVAAAAMILFDGGNKGGHTIGSNSDAVDLIYDLDNGEYERVNEAMNDEMRSRFSAEETEAVWKEQTEGLGAFESVEMMEVTEEEDGTRIDLYCAFEFGGKKVSIIVDETGHISDLLFEDYEQDLFDTIPEGLKEVGVKVNAGGKWELDGKITMGAGGQSDTAVIIVHGSGPSNMDGTVGSTRIYRDISWGLAQYGIDVLRYDKRTYVYGFLSADNIEKLTVKEETMDDAIAAAEMMKLRGYERVFLLGHSMGGMLAPAIVEESNGLFDGFISLAGSPRTLPEIQADQNLAAATPQNSALVNLFVAMELAKLEQIDSWTESELLSKTIFGLPAYYVKDMISRDAGKIAASLDVPMLFLQGSADFQVYAEKDFKKWQEILDGKEKVGFKLYNGLNHLFMVSQGDDAGTTDEYKLKGHVSRNVFRDIAEFISG